MEIVRFCSLSRKQSRKGQAHVYKRSKCLPAGEMKAARSVHAEPYQVLQGFISTSYRGRERATHMILP